MKNGCHGTGREFCDCLFASQSSMISVCFLKALITGLEKPSGYYVICWTVRVHKLESLASPLKNACVTRLDLIDCKRVTRELTWLQSEFLRDRVSTRTCGI